MKNTLFYILSFIVSGAVYGQSEEHKTNFIFPTSGPIYLSGTFGELRSNHFHSGIDIKTDSRTGKAVVAIADGYVSRIKVAPGGYGKALYIDHPNGYTSVYGHLWQFTGEVNQYVKDGRA